MGLSNVKRRSALRPCAAFGISLVLVSAFSLRPGTPICIEPGLIPFGIQRNVTERPERNGSTERGGSERIELRHAITHGRLAQLRRHNRRTGE